METLILIKDVFEKSLRDFNLLDISSIDIEHIKKEMEQYG